jgi:formylglycine-generating enzyme required for sulfatase activity
MAANKLQTPPIDVNNQASHPRSEIGKAAHDGIERKRRERREVERFQFAGGKHAVSNREYEETNAGGETDGHRKCQADQRGDTVGGDWRPHEVGELGESYGQQDPQSDR